MKHQEYVNHTKTPPKFIMPSSSRLSYPSSPLLFQHLRYQYHGSDKSLLYRYALSPLAEKCVLFLPSWMAPNLVTTIGLSLTTASYLLLYLFVPGLVSGETTPWWVFPVAALGLFVYQTLDNMDGKQARRTGSSSPLGLLFDHGCDAINCCFGIVFVSAIIDAGASLPLLAAAALNQLVPFFFTTWEHYYTNELILPIVNGPSEGVILGAVCACLRGAFGPELFASPREELNGWPLGHFLMACSLFGVVLTTAKQFVMVARARTAARRDMLKPVQDCSWFVAILAVGGVWAFGRPELFADAPYTMVLLFGLLHVDMAVHVMVCHICNTSCRSFRPILMPFFLVVANSLAPRAPLVDEKSLIWGFTALAFVYEALYLYLVVSETSQALDIYVFKLGKRSDAAADTSTDTDTNTNNGDRKKVA
ncbi:unnamed protein product [Pylaiella littoralis]